MARNDAMWKQGQALWLHFDVHIKDCFC